MEHNHEEEFNETLENTITLTDDDGSEISFEYIDSLVYEDKEYVALLPCQDEDDELVILQVEPDPDNEEYEQYLSVDDEDLLERVFDEFKKRLSEQFDFLED
ncbi:MAG: DUF1292 domain-containing protein [Massiliimalia sp.]|jgi:uncharacterized protein YrzB (UPF0473 family)